MNPFDDDNTRWFYKPGELHASDTAHLHDGKWIGDYGKKTEDEVRAAGLLVLTWDEFNKASEEAHKKLVTDPVECTEDDYYEALECLPPHRMGRFDEVCFFAVSEFYSWDITSFYTRYRGEFFTFRDHAGATKEHIASKVKQAYDHKKTIPSEQ